MGPPWRRRLKLKKTVWVSKKLLKKVEQVGIHILLLTEGLEALGKEALDTTEKGGKERLERNGKNYIRQMICETDFRMDVQGWGTERHLPQPKWKHGRVWKRTEPLLSVHLWRQKWDQKPGCVPLQRTVFPEARFPFLYPEVWAWNSPSLSPCLLYVIRLLVFGDILFSSHETWFFLICKITGTFDNSFTMAQFQKCNDLLQEADKSFYV